MLSQRPDPTNSDNIIVKDEHLGINMYVAKPGWKKGEFNVEPHPHAKQYFPHLHSHPELMINGGKKLECRKSDIAEVLQGRHDRMLKTGFQPKLRFEYSHTEPGNGRDVRHFNVYDHKTGEHIGVGTNSDKYDHSPIPKVMAMNFSHSFSHDIDPGTLKAKGSDVYETSDLHRVVDTLRAEKGKVKSFTGNSKGDSSFNTFNTPHEPEEASKRYEAHMRKNDRASNFVRHSPTHFSFRTSSGGMYSTQEHHVFASPGMIMHHTNSLDSKKTNTTILESFKKFKGQK